MTPSELHDVLKQRAEDIKRAIGSTGLVAVAQDEIVQILSALRAVEGAKVALKNIATGTSEWMIAVQANSALTHLEGLK